MNNKYIEALEKMKILFFNIKGCTHSTSGQPNKRAYELAKEGQDIATQALAPQECDADKYLKEILYELNCDAKYAIENIKALRKQLHSQEKTFTVDEITKKIKELLSAHCYFVATDGAFMLKKDILDLLAEFEKDVE